MDWAEWLSTGGGALLAILAVFFLVGFRRGVRRELNVLLGVGVGWGLARLAGPGLIRWVNRAYKTVAFVARSIVGPGDPGAAWNQARDLADPLDPQVHVRPAALALLALGVGIAYLVGERRYPNPVEFGARLLGGLTAVVNGYLIVGEVTRFLGVTPSGISTSTYGVTAQSRNGDSVGLIVVAITVLFIAFGLYSARRTGAGRPPGQ